MELSQIRENFEKKYRTMLEEVMAKRIKIAVCTIYNPNFENPQYQKMAVTALDIFNGCIIKVASEKGLPILDLRQVFTENKDYANPIEPSQLGGQKIAKLIKKVVSGHDWEKNVTVIYKD